MGHSIIIVPGTIYSSCFVVQYTKVYGGVTKKACGCVKSTMASMGMANKYSFYRHRDCRLGPKNMMWAA